MNFLMRNSEAVAGWIILTQSWALKKRFLLPNPGTDYLQRGRATVMKHPLKSHP